MSFGQPRRKNGYQAKKKKGFLETNKKFTAILLLAILGTMGGVHAFMWSLWDKTCIVSCDDPTVGCFSPVGYLAIFGPCHYYDWKVDPENRTLNHTIPPSL
jgi:hypothetical protein